PARSIGRHARVKWKMAFTLSASTLSHAASGYSATGAPQLAPALLTRMSSRDSRAATAAASASQPARVTQAPGAQKHVPMADSYAATRSHTSFFRDETYTFAPASTYPRAIISPMPREPPVTRATLPLTENRSLMAGTL